MRIGVPVALLSAMLALLAVGQQAHRQQQARTPAQPEAGQDLCQRALARHQEILAEMQRMDQQLQQGVQRMNAATGSAKIEAMADVINLMAAQRQEMQQKLMAMHRNITAHLSDHVQRGNTQQLSQCPISQAAQ